MKSFILLGGDPVSRAQNWEQAKGGGSSRGGETLYNYTVHILNINRLIYQIPFIKCLFSNPNMNFKILSVFDFMRAQQYLYI